MAIPITAGTTSALAPDTIGRRLDAAIAKLERQPWVLVGVGLVAGYLVSRLLER